LEPDAEIIKDLGTYWETANTAIKPYPCCRLAHRPIEAAHKLRNLFPDAVLLPDGMNIDVTVSRKAFGAVGTRVHNKTRPTNVVERQFNLNFQYAVALLYSRNDWGSYQLL
jgi:2-methylcitrate dehydratase PrpD